MKNFKLLALGFMAVLISAFVITSTVGAEELTIRKEVNITSSKTIDSMVFAGGDNVNISATINGDVFCIGENVFISGDIKGDVFCMGQTISISGNIDGSARLIARQVNVSGTIIDNLTVGAMNLVIDDNGIIGNDLLGLSDNISIKGQIGRDIMATSTSLSIGGSVGRDVTGYYETISINSGTIYGELNYTGKNQPELSNEGSIIGSVTRSEPTTNDENYKTSYSKTVSSIVWSIIYSLISLGGLAIILTLLIPRIFEKSAQNVIKSPAIVAVTGLIAAGIVPIAIIMSLISFVGIPIALFGLLIWIVISIMGAFFAAYLLGKLILNKSSKPVLIMLVGVSILIVANFIPIINFLTFMAVGIFGTGSVLVYIYNILKSQRSR